MGPTTPNAPLLLRPATPNAPTTLSATTPHDSKFFRPTPALKMLTSQHSESNKADAWHLAESLDIMSCDSKRHRYFTWKSAAFAALVLVSLILLWSSYAFKAECSHTHRQMMSRIDLKKKLMELSATTPLTMTIVRYKFTYGFGYTPQTVETLHGYGSKDNVYGAIRGIMGGDRIVQTLVDARGYLTLDTTRYIISKGKEIEFMCQRATPEEDCKVMTLALSDEQYVPIIKKYLDKYSSLAEHDKVECHWRVTDLGTGKKTHSKDSAAGRIKRVNYREKTISIKFIERVNYEVKAKHDIPFSWIVGIYDVDDKLQKMEDDDDKSPFIAVD